MNLETILSDLDHEIAKLRQARELLLEERQVTAKRPGRPKGSGKTTSAPASVPAKKQGMTPEGKARIAAAQRARWAAKKSGKA